MTELSRDELAAVAKILERIDDGKIGVPHLPGPVGLFLSQYATARIGGLMALGADPSRAWVDGRDLAPVTLYPILPFDEAVGDRVLGPRGWALVASDSVGLVLSVTLWMRANAASKVARTWRADPSAGIELDGRYRLHPPTRLSPGEAQVGGPLPTRHWSEIRCLKYTGDDFISLPTAADTHLDWTPPPGLKSWRVVAAEPTDRTTARVVGGLRPPRSPQIIRTATSWDPSASALLALVFGSPWTDVWDAIDAVPATPTDVLAHSLSWADFLRELQGDGPIEPNLASALQDVVRKTLGAADLGEAARKASLNRELEAAFRPLVRVVRGA